VWDKDICDTGWWSWVECCMYKQPETTGTPNIKIMFSLRSLGEKLGDRENVVP
jgi:hypothetical protein